MEPNTDRRGQIIEEDVEGYTTERYSVNSVYTLTKYKLNMKHVEVLTKYKTFEEYLRFMKIDIVNATGVGGSALKAANLMEKPSFGFEEGTQAQISSRPQMDHTFESTVRHVQLRKEIEKGTD